MIKPSFENIYRLGLKEIQSILRDRALQGLILFSFSIGVYIAATGRSNLLHSASIGIVDEDQSQLAYRIRESFRPPYFKVPELISFAELDRSMDSGRFLFTVVIPNEFEHKVLRGDQPDLQVNVDATAVMQAGIGAGYIQSIVTKEVATFLTDVGRIESDPVLMKARYAFNPNLEEAWFNGIMEIINKVTVVAMLLTGAALLRERERGTIEHLLTLPVTPFEIIMSKVWANALVVLSATLFAVLVVISGILGIEVAGSIPLFMFCATVYMLFASALGIFMGTVTKAMPQFGLLVMLVMMPLIMLSGGQTPIESEPFAIRYFMLLVPSTHFVRAAQAILNRGAGIDVIWPNLVVITLVGTMLFLVATLRFRKSIIAAGK